MKTITDKRAAALNDAAKALVKVYKGWSEVGDTTIEGAKDDLLTRGIQPTLDFIDGVMEERDGARPILENILNAFEDHYWGDGVAKSADFAEGTSERLVLEALETGSPHSYAAANKDGEFRALANMDGMVANRANLMEALGCVYAELADLLAAKGALLRLHALVGA